MGVIQPNWIEGKWFLYWTLLVKDLVVDFMVIKIEAGVLKL